MTKKKLTRLIETKTKLAEKYERLTKLANSAPKKATFQRQASYFRHQARMLEIKTSQLS